MKYQLKKSELFRASLYLTLHEAWKKRIIRFLFKFILIITIGYLCISGDPAPFQILIPLGIFYLFYVFRAYQEYQGEGVLEPAELLIEEGALKVIRRETREYPLNSKITVREYLGLLFLFWISEGQGYFLIIPVRVFADTSRKRLFLQQVREVKPKEAFEETVAEETERKSEHMFDSSSRPPQRGLLGYSARLAWKKLWSVRFLKPGILLLTAGVFAFSMYMGDGEIFGFYLSQLVTLILIAWVLIFCFTLGSFLDTGQEIPLKKRMVLIFISGVLLLILLFQYLSRCRG